MPKGFTYSLKKEISEQIDDEPSSEQLARVAELEKQIAEAEAKKAQEEKVREEQAMQEQIARVAELEKQIAEIEEIQANAPKFDENLDEEATPEQLERKAELERQIAKLESQEAKLNSVQDTSEIPAEEDMQVDNSSKIHDTDTSEQLAKLSELEKQILELEKALQNAQKLEDESESDTTTPTISIKENKASSSNSQAYCVKCKKKRDIKDPQDTTMKNGRPAIRGTCSVCGSKVFRIKSKKK